MTKFSELQARPATTKLTELLDGIVRATDDARAAVLKILEAYHEKVRTLVSNYFSDVWNIQTTVRGPWTSGSYYGNPGELMVTIEQFPLTVGMPDTMSMHLGLENDLVPLTVDLNRRLRTQRPDWRQKALMIVAGCYNEIELLTFKGASYLQHVCRFAFKLSAARGGQTQKEG